MREQELQQESAKQHIFDKYGTPDVRLHIN